VSVVSVVIPTRGHRPQLREILAALEPDPAVREIIVVDDGPGGPPAPLTAKASRIHSHGIGPGGARQAGVEVATGPLVLLLDDDVVPGPGLASGHAARHDVGGRVVLGYMPVAEPARPGEEPSPVALYRSDYARRVAAYERSPESVLTHLWAGNVSLRRVDALAVGLASPAFAGHRHEDRDFGLRCLEAGLTGAFDRRLRATHHYERSVAAFLDDAYAQGVERVILHRCHAATIGPFHPTGLAEGLPWPARRLLALARRPRAVRAVALGLDRALALARRARLRSLELQGLKLARRVRQQEGALAAARGAAAGARR
jgi:GT2 family glycosyltransferase